MFVVRRLSVGRIVAFTCTLLACGTTARAQYPITRISLDSSGHEGDGASGCNEFNGFVDLPAALSDDGRFVAFESVATNLVSGDTNAATDIFVHDNVTGATVRVSIDSSGNQSNGYSLYPAISGDGRFVTFMSVADNLVANDTNGYYDSFRHDRDPDGNGIFDEGNGVTERASVDSNGVEGNRGSFYSDISADGNLVVFDSDSDNLVASDKNRTGDIFLHDFSTGKTTRITPGSNGGSYSPSISADGKFVAFTSVASNLVAGDTNRTSDVFVYDRTAKTMTRVSVDSSGSEASGFGPSPLSRDGSIVAFRSYASNLVAGDTNNMPDVFVHDLTSGVTTRESVGSGGVQFSDYSDSPSLSGDGNVVTFMRFVLKSGSGGVFPTYFRPFARDRAADTTLPLNVDCGGVAADGDGMYPGVSDDGRFVAFSSYADNLVAGDTNATGDVFLYDLTIVEPDAAWSNYGSGFAGTFGVPSLTLSADPVLGTTPNLDASNSLGAATSGFLLAGPSQASIGTKWGGTILVAYSWIAPVALPAAGLSLPFPLALDPAFCGVSAYAQVIELDAGAPFGLSFTPGVQVTFGK